MDSGNLFIIVVLLAGAFLSLGLFLYFLVARPKADMRSLMVSAGPNAAMEMRRRLEEDKTGEEFERVKALVQNKHRKKVEPTIAERMFRAGMFSDQQRKDFRRIQLLCPIVIPVIFTVLGFSTYGMSILAYLFTIMGFILGFYMPFKILDRRQAARDEEILYYLPLVIEQIAIGVSSSLDVGPCLQRIVQMADERDTHNPVTELIRYTQFHIQSGASMEEALKEVGLLAGHLELKHAFTALSQVAKFGGEVTRQLQELADAVSTQRETKIEAKIKKLELSATGPVAFVFLSFMVSLLMGFGLQVMKAF